jgi:hypothetical protein
MSAIMLILGRFHAIDGILAPQEKQKPALSGFRVPHFEQKGPS